MVGWLSVTNFLASVSLINLQSALFTLPQGLASSACNLVGNSLGANHPNNSQKYAKAGIIASLLISFTLCPLMIIFRDFIAGLYTVNPDVRECLASVIPIIAVFVLCDHLQCIE